MNICNSILLLFIISIVSGCTGHSRIKNIALETVNEEKGYTMKNIQERNKKDDLRIFLAFSGGGTRAAALSYGVLEELRDTEVIINNRPKTLLSEVNSISSVSGGSFTSAYYGLYGDAIFTDYEKDFLKQDVQKVLIRGLLNPFNWIRAIFSGFDRTEIAINYYDKHIFKGATFADFRKDGPFIQINATDLNSGQIFSFKQEYFNFLCSDLSRLKVARAVTASSAVPVVFAPIVFKNYDDCDYKKYNHLLDILSEQGDIRVKQVASALNNYLDKDKIKYVHMVDGGISDNLGIRGLYDSVHLHGGIKRALNDLNVKPPKYLVLILVNAAVSPEKSMNKSPDIPSLADQIDATSSAQIERYTVDTIQLLKESLVNWQSDFSKISGQEVKTYLIQVDFLSIKDKEKFKSFNRVSSSLALPAEVVDKVRHEGRILLRNSPEFKKLLSELNEIN